MSTVKLSCIVEPTDPAKPLNFGIYLDHQSLFQLSPVTRPTPVKVEIPDDTAQHVLSFRMSGKTADHTQLDINGDRVQDSCLKISQISFDDIDITNLLPQTAVYHHDFNGTGAPTQDHFYELMGCNGSVDLAFTTPVYLWLLENM
jgi:hypothetical protein